MPRFVKAEAGPWNSVIYTDDGGNRFIVRGGDPNYRNNNPGNLVPGRISKRNGQIGVAGRFAVFPDIATGRKAMRDSLKTTYGDSDLAQMIEGYAPKHENNTKRYLTFLRKQIGVKDDLKIKDFSALQFDSLCAAIEKFEGRDKASPVPYLGGKKAIIRVRKDKKGTITHYDVEGLGWLSKPEALAFAHAGEIDAVIAKSKAGKPFLRTRPDITIVNNLENKE